MGGGAAARQRDLRARGGLVWSLVEPFCVLVIPFSDYLGT